MTDDSRIDTLVCAFGDAGLRLKQAMQGKFSDDLPDALKSHSILISGCSGVGKTLLLSQLAHHLHCKVLKINMGKLISFGGQHTGLKRLFNSIQYESPTLVWLVDAELFRGLYARVVEEFVGQIKSLKSRCLVVMSTRKPEQLAMSLRSYDDHIPLQAPGSNFERLCLCEWFAMGTLDSDTVNSVVLRSHGKTAAEVFSILEQLIKARDPNTDDKGCFKKSLESLPGCVVRWEDVGGLDDIIDELKEAIVWPIIYRDQFQRLGIQPPRGALLYGPPGTGKTMLAKAAATEVSANFIAIAIPDLIKGEVGESEKALSLVFSNAKRSPTILFLDEIEAIFGNRESAGEVGRKLISQLFLEMDNIPEDARVVILAATNAPHLMDDSILRPGRLDKMIHVPRPGRSSRLDIFKRVTRNLDIENNPELFEWLADMDMSGAEIKAVVRGACYSAIERGSKTLNKSDFEAAVEASNISNDFGSVQEEW